MHGERKATSYARPQSSSSHERRVAPLSTLPTNISAGKNLQAQYERWQPRAKYKMHLDPTVEDVKKLCLSCRRNAKVGALSGSGGAEGGALTQNRGAILPFAETVENECFCKCRKLSCVLCSVAACTESGVLGGWR